MRHLSALAVLLLAAGSVGLPNPAGAQGLPPVTFTMPPLPGQASHPKLKPRTAQTYQEAVDFLAGLYARAPQTLLCGCAYQPSPTTSDGAVDDSSCGYKPRASVDAADRIAWMHIVSPAEMAAGHACWRAGDGEAENETRCLQTDAQFRAMWTDMQNIAPEIKEIVQDRGGMPLDVIPDPLEKPQHIYGACAIGVHPGRGMEPAPSARGAVARAYLYMRDAWGVRLGGPEISLLQSWAKANPPSDWEIARDHVVGKMQNANNPYIANPPK